MLRARGSLPSGCLARAATGMVGFIDGLISASHAMGLAIGTDRSLRTALDLLASVPFVDHIFHASRDSPSFDGRMCKPR